MTRTSKNGDIVGDEVLKFVVNKVGSCLGKDDFIGRLGVDEFFVADKS